MKYTRTTNTNFNYMDAKIASFNPNWNQIGTIAAGAGAGALGLGIAGSIANSKIVNDSRTPQETKKYMRYADQFNEGFDGWQNSTNPNKGWIADRSTPEGKRFIDTGERFINEDERLREKYSNKGLLYGSLGAGAALGGGIAYGLSKMGRR